MERPIVTRPMTGNTFSTLISKNWPVGVPMFQPGKPQKGDPASAVTVNHGRWVAHCPHCPGAQLADPDDHRFFCIDCLNQHCEGRVIYARWPRNHAAIAKRLLPRPDPSTRNWDPTETLADLDAENIEHRVVKV